MAEQKNITWHALFVSLTAMPSVLFFIIGICGMILMFIFGAKLDKTDVKSNWIEQCTNLVAQLCFFAGNYTCVIEKTTNSGYPESAVFY